MSKAKNTRKAPAKKAAPAAQVQMPKVTVMPFLVFAFKSHSGGIKTPIQDEATGKALLKEIYVSLNEGKPYFNEERGILINPGEVSHVYLAQEQVKAQ